MAENFLNVNRFRLRFLILFDVLAASLGRLAMAMLIALKGRRLGQPVMKVVMIRLHCLGQTLVHLLRLQLVRTCRRDQGRLRTAGTAVARGHAAYPGPTVTGD